MTLELPDVKCIAHLVRIEASENEATQTLTRLNQSFSLVEQIQVTDTTGIEPVAHPTKQVQAQVQRLRDDAVIETDRRADCQQYTPVTKAGLYLVPKVVK